MTSAPKTNKTQAEALKTFQDGNDVGIDARPTEDVKKLMKETAEEMPAQKSNANDFENRNLGYSNLDWQGF